MTPEANLHDHSQPAPIQPNPTILDDLRQILTRFVILPKWAAETLALWILHTHAFHLRDVSTYLGVESPEKRCGKTTLLAVLSELVSRPVVAGNISSSAFLRVIEQTQPTLLIDEADAFLQRNHGLRAILNSGYTRKTAYVVRLARSTAPFFHPSTNPPQSDCLARFSCWCPKVFATIGRLPDTLADRCILLSMQRKTARETCERSRNLHTLALREHCASFVAAHSQTIATAQPAIPSLLNDRAADLWEPLLVLADLVGGEWPALARQAAAALTTSTQDQNPVGSLLLDIHVLFVTSKSQRIFSRVLARGLNTFSDRPWMQAQKGKEVTELWLSHQLRPYGIRPRAMRIGDERAKGYFKDDFMDAFRRYIPRSELDTFLAESTSTE
jgi:hypothetical protein